MNLMKKLKKKRNLLIVGIVFGRFEGFINGAQFSKFYNINNCKKNSPSCLETVCINH